MKIFKEVQVLKKELDKIVCDVCKKEYSFEEDYSTHAMEIQEFYNIDFVGGFTSIFGDTNKVECNLCQYCLKVLLGPYLRIIKEN